MIGAEISARYIRFAEEEARGRSPLYEAIARGVAADRDVIGFLLGLPTEKQQPNLLLAAVRHLFGTPRDWPGFRELLLSDRDAVRAVMQSRSTQTNEPARCATLLPVLARLPQPLALIEVGASAGLCLLPDHYGFDYGRAILGPRSPTFRCAVNDAAPVPVALPRIVWRAGLDLNPLDVADPRKSHGSRRWSGPSRPSGSPICGPRSGSRSTASRASSRAISPATGSLSSHAKRRATPRSSIFHTAVLAYVADLADRQAFAARAMRLGTWISNEMPGVFPDIARACRCARPGRPLSPVGQRHAGRVDRPARRFARLDLAA